MTEEDLEAINLDDVLVIGGKLYRKKETKQSKEENDDTLPDDVKALLNGKDIS